MNWDYFQIYLQSNLLEWPAYIFLARRLGLTHVFFRVSLFNAITHPLVTFWLMRLPMSYLQNIFVAETFAVLAETILIRRYLDQTLVRAFGLSVLANLISWQFGPALTYLRFF